MLQIDVIVIKRKQHLLPVKYTECVIDISSIEQNRGALIVLYPILFVMPHEKVGQDEARGEPIDTSSISSQNEPLDKK